MVAGHATNPPRRAKGPASGDCTPLIFLFPAFVSVPCLVVHPDAFYEAGHVFLSVNCEGIKAGSRGCMAGEWGIRGGNGSVFWDPWVHGDVVAFLYGHHVLQQVFGWNIGCEMTVDIILSCGEHLGGPDMPLHFIFDLFSVDRLHGMNVLIGHEGIADLGPCAAAQCYNGIFFHHFLLPF